MNKKSEKQGSFPCFDFKIKLSNQINPNDPVESVQLTYNLIYQRLGIIPAVLSKENMQSLQQKKVNLPKPQEEISLRKDQEKVIKYKPQEQISLQKAPEKTNIQKQHVLQEEIANLRREEITKQKAPSFIEIRLNEVKRGEEILNQIEQDITLEFAKTQESNFFDQGLDNGPDLKLNVKEINKKINERLFLHGRNLRYINRLIEWIRQKEMMRKQKRRRWISEWTQMQMRRIDDIERRAKEMTRDPQLTKKKALFGLFSYETSVQNTLDDFYKKADDAFQERPSISPRM